MPLNNPVLHVYSCAQYPREDICEKAVDFCCPGSALYVSFCYCDFYSWASLLGYQSDLAAGWCSTSETYLNQISNIANDNFGLRMFYQQLGGDFWLDNTGWMSTTPHCEWFGVECSEDRVVLIDLNSNNLTGSVSFFGEIPDDGTDSGSLFKLQELYVIVFFKQWRKAILTFVIDFMFLTVILVTINSRVSSITEHSFVIEHYRE